MIAYVDASVLLRLTLGQPAALGEWSGVERMITSSLTEVECLRALDRYRLRGLLPDAHLAGFRATVLRILQSAERVAPDPAVLTRAASPLPTSLGTLDAIHLSTALLWREEFAEDLVMATHDVQLGIAARSFGMTVIGLSNS